jgi:hypothetical protein
MSGETYADHTYLFRVHNGVVFPNTYSEDGSRLRYETLEDPTAGARRSSCRRPRSYPGSSSSAGSRPPA